VAWFSDEQLKSLQKGFVYVVIIALANAILQLYGELTRERAEHNDTKQKHLQYVEEEMRAWRDLATGYRDTVYLPPDHRKRGKTK
jgi:hypothetical protein